MISIAGTKDMGGDNQTSVGKEQVRNYIVKLDVFKSSGSDKIHPRVLQKLNEVTAEPLASL